MSSDADLSLDEIVARERFDAEQRADDGAGPDDGADGEIVLPWWQHPVNIVTLVVTAAILAAMIGWLVGDSGAEPDHNEVDVGFLQDMRTHHEQAVLMSFIYRNAPDTDPGLRTVARSILIGQNQEVGRMIQLLLEFGEIPANTTDTSMAWMGMAADRERMPGMATDDELDQLGRLDGRAADELFVELMSEHHVGGIEMAEFAAANADNDDVVAFATSMASAQASEIVEMDELLDRG